MVSARPFLYFANAGEELSATSLWEFGELLLLRCSGLKASHSFARRVTLRTRRLSCAGLPNRIPIANCGGFPYFTGDGEYLDDQHHHHHQAPSQAGSDERPAQAFTGYGSYTGAPHGSSSMPSIHDALDGSPVAGGSAIAARRLSRSRNDEPEDLFPDIPEAKRRKFILVEDSDRQSRLRVRVTLDGVDTREIPDSFRKSSSVYPRSYFAREMQSPPPSATGSKFFSEDASDMEDDGTSETEGRRAGRGGGKRGKTMIKVPMSEGQEGEVAIPRMRKSFRGKEVRLNDLGYRMAWLQSRVFAGRTVFLQRACESLIPHPPSQRTGLTLWQWTAIGTRHAARWNRSCRMSRRRRPTTRRGWESESGQRGCV